MNMCEFGMHSQRFVGTTFIAAKKIDSGQRVQANRGINLVAFNESSHYSANSVFTPLTVPSKSTSAGFSANSPLVTTPVMLLIRSSIASG